MRPVNALSTTSEWNSIDVIPAAVSKGKSEAKFTSSDFGFDAQHIKPINASAWEWYYFDAVSVDGLHSVAIVMYTAPATGFFGGGPPDDIIVSEVFASTPQNPQFFDQYTLGSEAIVSSIGNGANGLWKGTGFRFGGKHDLSSVNVEIDSPQIGVKGCVKLKSVSLCGLMGSGKVVYEHKLDCTSTLPVWASCHRAENGCHASCWLGERHT